MAITLLSVPTSSHHQTLFSPRPHVSNNSTNCNSLTTLTISRCPAKPILAPLLCTSSSTSSAPVAEDSDAAIPVASESAALQQSEGLPFSGCKTCGKEEIERGCNGEGRIQGGIATVPGFGWWPIKAYRPCPGFVASGGRYRRQGQSMDEVAFGRGERGTSVGANTEVETEKKRRDPWRFNR